MMMKNNCLLYLFGIIAVTVAAHTVTTYAAAPYSGTDSGLVATSQEDPLFDLLDTDYVTVEFVVSPQVIVLLSKSDNCVTVHANIAYALVAGDTITLNGLGAYATFADNRGEFVAKFDLNRIKQMVSPPDAIMMLRGQLKDGTVIGGEIVVGVR